MDGNLEQPKKSAEKPKRKTPQTSWSVKGVSLETRAMVTQAAKRQRSKLGPWIDRALLEAAQNALKPPKPPAPPPEQLIQSLFDKMEASHTELKAELADLKRPWWKRG